MAFVLVARPQESKGLLPTTGTFDIPVPYLPGKFLGKLFTFRRIDTSESSIHIGFYLSNRLDNKENDSPNDHNKNEIENIRHTYILLHFGLKEIKFLHKILTYA